jgi:hypothetical protein
MEKANEYKSNKLWKKKTIDNRRNLRKKSRKEEWIQKWVSILCEVTAGCGADQTRRK